MANASAIQRSRLMSELHQPGAAEQRLDRARQRSTLPCDRALALVLDEQLRVRQMLRIRPRQIEWMPRIRLVARTDHERRHLQGAQRVEAVERQRPRYPPQGIGHGLRMFVALEPLARELERGFPEARLRRRFVSVHEAVDASERKPVRERG